MAGSWLAREIAFLVAGRTVTKPGQTAHNKAQERDEGLLIGG
jgi:hypothetical protein